MRVEDDTKIDYSDVLLRPKRSTLNSRNDVNLERTFIFNDEPYTCIPIIAANMDTTGTIEMAKAFNYPYKMNVALHKHYKAHELYQFFRYGSPSEYSWYTMGITIADYDRFKGFKNLIEGNSEKGWNGKICIDVANGYTERFLTFVRKMRDENPCAVIMAGNVVTAEMTEALILAGANVVKVGIGSGSACYTRLVSGVGYPQLSAINECADAAHGLSGYICADGGCVTPGDIAKSFAAGADFSMIGGMLSGHDESGGEIIEEDGKKFKLFYGMSSETAMNKYAGGVAKHRASEGRTIKVPYRGPVEDTIQNILGGVRSACTYIGARRIKDMPKCATFVRVNNQLNTSFESYTIGN